MTPKQMNDYLAERLNRTDPKFLDKLTAFEATQLGLLHNILGMQGILVQQNDILINHFCPPPKKEEEDENKEIPKVHSN